MAGTRYYLYQMPNELYTNCFVALNAAKMQAYWPWIIGSDANHVEKMVDYKEWIRDQVTEKGKE